MSKKTGIDKPFSPEALADYGVMESVPPVLPSHDPRKPWRLNYQIWMTGRKNYIGMLSLAYTPPAGFGPASLTAEQRLIIPSYCAEEITHAHILCNPNPLLTPAKWTLTTRMADLPSGKEYEPLKFKTEASADRGEINGNRNSLPFTLRVSIPWSSHWSLMAALPAADGKRLPKVFTLLDDFDKLKPGQQLVQLPPETIPYGRTRIRTQRLVQTGYGVLPINYYYDEQGRMLMIISGQKACFLNPSIKKVHAEMMRQAIKRGPTK
jgi:hypothetical protein